MKVLFVRHGESQDDLESRYGGWSDFPLTSKGKSQIKSKVDEIKALGEKFEIVLTSPLQRAVRSAEILAESLKIPLEKFEYVKERNTYGLLSGMKKEDAKEKYLDQVEKLDAGDYVDGSERHEDLVERVRKSLKMLEERGQKSVVVVTHGNYLKSVFEDIIGKKLLKKEDGGFVLMELTKEKLTPLKSNGIEFE